MFILAITNHSNTGKSAGINAYLFIVMKWALVDSMEDLRGGINRCSRSVLKMCSRYVKRHATRRYVNEELPDIAIIKLPVEYFASSCFRYVKTSVISSYHECAGQKSISQNKQLNNPDIIIFSDP